MPNMNKEFICDKCGKIFKSSPSLRAHKSSHSEKITGYPNNIHEEHTIDFYKKAGIDCLIIWEHEIKNKSQLNIKINEFLNS